MPRFGATFDENSVPPWIKGDLRGVLGVTHNQVWAVDRGTHPGAARPCRSAPPLPWRGFSCEQDHDQANCENSAFTAR